MAFRLRTLTAIAVLAVVSALGVAAPASASAPIRLSGSAWLGGQGVNVCAPSTDPYCGTEYHVGGFYANWWQCVELAQRLYKARGWHTGIFSGVNYAYQIYDLAPNLGMTRQANGAITSLAPGDMIIHGTDTGGGAGHVSIVNSASGGTVSAVEQNASTTGWATYSFNGSTLSRPGTGTIRGVVHDPGNTNSSGGGGNSPSWQSRSDVDSNMGADLVITTKEAGGYMKAFSLLSTYEQFLSPQLWLDGSSYGWDGVTPLVGDVNGDRKSDYIFLTHEASGYMKAFVAKSTGSGFQTPQLWWNGAGYGYDGVKATLADVDGNRGADLVITTKEANGYFKTFALLSTYEQFLSPQLWLDGNGYGWSGVTPFTADVNGDGKSDFVFATHEASGYMKAFVSRSTGGGFQTPQLWWNGAGYGYDGVKTVMGDADGNGGADLIITTKEASGFAKTFVLLSTYEQFLQPQLWWDGTGYGWDGVTPLTGDVNGDNKADFVFLTHEASGYMKAFTAKSSGSGFYPPQLWWNGAGYGYDGVKAVLR